METINTNLVKGLAGELPMGMQHKVQMGEPSQQSQTSSDLFKGFDGSVSG